MLVFAFLLFAPSALQSDPEYVEGRRLYDEFEFEQAIFRFQKAALSADDDEERAEVFMWLGLSHAGIGDFERAERNFKDALLLRPDAQLPAAASPKVSALLEKARADAKKELAEHGSQTTTTTPEVTPGEPTTTPAAPGDEAGLPWSYGAAGVLGAVGVASFVAAGVVGVFLGQSLDVVNDPDAFQDDVIAAESAANTQIVVAGVLGGAGALLLGGAGAFAALGMLE